MASSLHLITQTRRLKAQRRQRLKEARERKEAKARARRRSIDFSRFVDDPVGFAVQLFGIEPLNGQAKLLRAAAEEDAVACRSGHKVGKSLALAILAWWFVMTRKQGRVVITAPTARQVRDVVWREVRALRRIAAARGFELPKAAIMPATGVRFDDGRQILGFSTDEPEAMAGISSPDLLYLIDEASGVDELIFEAIDGNLAGGARIVLTSNPTKTTGQFFRAFHSERSEWTLIHISSEDVANDNSRLPVPAKGTATLKWVERRKRIWGVADPRFQVRVRGNFPKESSTAVISIAHIEAARARWGDVEESQILDIGVDVARFGDDLSVAQPVRGYAAGKPKAVNGYNHIKVAGMVLEMVRELRGPGDRCRIKIDSGGGYGGPVADLLREWIREDPKLAHAVTVVEVNASEASLDKQYDLRRDELWFGIRTWLTDGGAFEGHDQLEEELLAPNYDFTARNGRLKVEPKKEIKKRLGRSPDFADALALAIWGQAHNDNALQEDAELLEEDEPTAQGFG